MTVTSQASPARPLPNRIPFAWGAFQVLGTCPPLLGQMWACPNRKMNMHVQHALNVCLPMIWTGNALKIMKHTHKGLFGEAQFLTTSHTVILGFYKCVFKDNKHPLFYAHPPPHPFENPGSTTADYATLFFKISVISDCSIHCAKRSGDY